MADCACRSDLHPRVTRFKPLMTTYASTPAARLIVLLVLGTSLSARAVPPDAGEASRMLQAPADLGVPLAVPNVVTTEAGGPVAGGESPQRIRVRQVRFSGNPSISTKELEALVADLIGDERSFDDILRAAAGVTALYRARGYPVARAIVPPQEVRDGEIAMQVLEGSLGLRVLMNQSRLTDERASLYFDNLHSGDVIYNAQLERSLQLAGDTPGVGAARAILQPGAGVGQADMLIALDPAPAIAMDLQEDNYGNRYLGEYRVAAALAWNSPLGWGDLFNVRVLTSGENLNYVRVAYQIPLGGDGFKIGAAQADTHYRLGQEFTALQQSGAARSSSVFISYPLVRSHTRNLFSTLSWEGKSLADEAAAVGSRDEKNLDLWTLEWSGNLADDVGGGGLLAFDTAFTRGTLAMDANSSALDAMPGAANAQGAFSKLTYTVQRAQRLNADYSMVATVSGQQADKNLNSSEKFSLGGANGVRAYPQGEGTGDQGVMLNLDLRRTISPQWQASVFYDGGSVDINHTPYTAGARTRTLAGQGLGLIGLFGSAQLKAVLAWPSQGGDAESDSVQRRLRLWLQFELPLR